MKILNEFIKKIYFVHEFRWKKGYPHFYLEKKVACFYEKKSFFFFLKGNLLEKVFSLNSKYQNRDYCIE